MKTHPISRMIARHLRRMGQEVRPDNIILQKVKEEDGLVTICAILSQYEVDEDSIDMKPVTIRFRFEEKKGFGNE